MRVERSKSKACDECGNPTIPKGKKDAGIKEFVVGPRHSAKRAMIICRSCLTKLYNAAQDVELDPNTGWIDIHTTWASPPS